MLLRWLQASRWVLPRRNSAFRSPSNLLTCPRAMRRTGLSSAESVAPMQLLWDFPPKRSDWFPWETPAGNGWLGGRPQLTAGIRAGSYALECSNLRFARSNQQWAASRFSQCGSISAPRCIFALPGGCRGGSRRPRPSPPAVIPSLPCFLAPSLLYTVASTKVQDGSSLESLAV